MSGKFVIALAVFAISTVFAIPGSSQSPAPARIEPVASAPTAADVVRQRVDRAKAYIAVKNYAAAIYELENIKRESSDRTLETVINVLLMNSYLEQTDYKRAENFLTLLSREQQSSKPGSAQNYFAVAAQVIRSANSQIDRYHSLGLNVSNPSLPEEAAADLRKMRSILELVISQSKEMGKSRTTMDSALALLEGATAARSNLAKDPYDANRWKTEVIDAREMLADSQTRVIDAVNPPAETAQPSTEDSSQPDIETVAQVPPSQDPEPKKVAEKPEEKVITVPKRVEPDPPAETMPKVEEVVAKKEDPPQKRKRIIVGGENSGNSGEVAKEVSASPIEVGSLTRYATRTARPVYPRVARSMRMQGIVRVEVVVDEDGRVADVQDTDGPALLRRAAEEAIVKWTFRPFERDGQPVRAVGFVRFNFNL